MEPNSSEDDRTGSVGTEKARQKFISLQHQLRGLIASFRSKHFVLKRTQLPHQAFRAGLTNLFLDARAALHHSQYRTFLEWCSEQLSSQSSELETTPLEYDALRGIYTDAPVISLNDEIRWITERLRIARSQIEAFLKARSIIQDLVFEGNYESAIETITQFQELAGVSLWSVQLRLALEHLAGGLERQKRYSAAVRSRYKVGLLGFLTYYTSVRNEDRTTLAKFMDDVDARIASHSFHTDATRTYDRYRLKGELPVSDVGLADVLRTEQNHSNVDIFETFITLMQELAKRGVARNRASIIVTSLTTLHVEDFRIAKIIGALDPALASSKKRRSNSLSNALIDGRVREAMRQALKLATPDPWQYIYAGFAFGHASRSRPTIGAARPTNVARYLGAILSQSESEPDAWAKATKLLINLSGLPLAVGLLDFTKSLKREAPDQVWQPWIVGFNSPDTGVEDIPWDAGHVEPLEDVTALAWRELREPSESSKDTHLLFRAAGFLYQRDFESSERILDVISVQWRPFFGLATSLRLHTYHALGRRQRIIELIAFAAAAHPDHVSLLPIVGSLRYFIWADYKAVTHPIAAPTALHLLWTTSEASETASQMRYSTGFALRRLGVQRPSDLNVGSFNIAVVELIYFLRKVCTPTILDLSRLFTSTQAILEERQAICGLLARIDPVRSQIYQDEILLIANELTIDEGHWIVDRTRIYVDSEGLIRWAARELSEDYARYLDLVGVHVENQQSFEDVLREIAAAQAQKNPFQPDNEADAILASIMTRLAEEFLNNATFGLDFFLSKGVRHQSFIGLIRGPLEFSNLITTRESEAGEYHPNTVWLDRFEKVDAAAREKIDAALRSFAQQFDELLLKAKDTQLHLRGPDKPHGMIVLVLDERLVNIARAVIHLDFLCPEFIRIMIPVLWTGVEASLKSIRLLITDELKSAIIKEFDFLRAKVRDFAEQDPAWLEFDAAVGNAASDVQIKLDEAANWFIHGETLRSQRTFSLEQMLAIGVDTALKSLRGFEPVISQSTGGNLYLRAPDLVFFHDVLFVGLGNARKHSGLKAPKIDVSADWDASNGTVTLSVECDCRKALRPEKEKKALLIQDIIKEGKHHKRTRIEGGSGFAKLAPVVSSSEKGRMNFGFTDADRFRLEVSYAVVTQGSEKSHAA